MSTRVNLLPKESADRERASRARYGVAAGFGVLILGIAGAWWYFGTQVDDAQAELAADQEILTELQTDLASLSEFGQLSDRAQQANEDLAVVFGNEASLAGLLQDVAAVMPTDVELESLDATVNTDAVPTLGDVRPAIGLVSMTGRTIRGHAPGVERLMLELDKLATLDDLFMSSSTLEENEILTSDVAAFSVEADLASEARTLRYLIGLPEVMR